jgi:hypothetical protein
MLNLSITKTQIAHKSRTEPIQTGRETAPRVAERSVACPPRSGGQGRRVALEAAPDGSSDTERAVIVATNGHAMFYPAKAVLAHRETRGGQA